MSISYFWHGAGNDTPTFDTIAAALAWWGDDPPSSIQWEERDGAGIVVRTGGELVWEDANASVKGWRRWEQTANGLVRLD